MRSVFSSHVLSFRLTAFVASAFLAGAFSAGILLLAEEAKPAPSPGAPPVAKSAEATRAPAASTPTSPAAPAPAGQSPAPAPTPAVSGAPTSGATPSAAPENNPQSTTPAAKKIYRPLPPPANFSPPILHVDQADFDWGSVLQGEVVKHSFAVVNKGGAPLNITRVKPSCGCTTVAKPEKAIDPGQTGLITLEIDTKRFTGPIKKTADVESNASPTPFKLQMGGKVDAFFSTEPAAPRLEVVRGVPSEPTKVTLRKTSTIDFKFKELKTESKVLTAEYKEVEPGKTYEVVLSCTLGDDPRKYYYERVDAKLDVGGKDFDMPINVQVVVKDRIDVQPRSTVYFARNEVKPLKDGQATGPITKSVDIKSLGGPDHNFNITKVEGGTNGFETKVETVTAGKHYRLIVTLPQQITDTKTHTLRDKIVLHTDDPTLKELAINAIAALQ
jgi:hypothetical protein